MLQQARKGLCIISSDIHIVVFKSLVLRGTNSAKKTFLTPSQQHQEECKLLTQSQLCLWIHAVLANFFSRVESSNKVLSRRSDDSPNNRSVVSHSNLSFKTYFSPFLLKKQAQINSQITSKST